MSKNRTPRITRRTAARMLRGAPVVVPGALADLLAAAAAPPHDGELVGEGAAVAAFREAARPATIPRPRSRSMIHSTLAKLLTVKVAAVVAAVLTAGGVATAAAIGHLPSPHDGSPAVTSSHPAGGAATARSTHSARGAVPTDRAGSPSPSLVGLCRAYTAGATDHGAVLANPAFSSLVTAAGGRAEVGTYCAALLASKPPASSGQGAGRSSMDGAPGRSAAGHQASTDHPTGPPATHPSGPPATHPTGAPTTHPTGGSAHSTGAVPPAKH